MLGTISVNMLGQSENVGDIQPENVGDTLKMLGTTRGNLKMLGMN